MTRGRNQEDKKDDVTAWVIFSSGGMCTLVTGSNRNENGRQVALSEWTWAGTRRRSKLGNRNIAFGCENVRHTKIHGRGIIAKW